MSKHLLGLFFGYSWIIVSTFLGASGFGIFLSYTAELFILLFFYSIYRTIDNMRNPKKYAKKQFILMIWIAATPVIAVHFIGIRFVLAHSNPSGDVPEVSQVLYEWQTWIALGAILFYYLFNFLAQPIARVVDLSRDRFVVGLILLTAINVAGIFVFTQIETPQFIIVISVMVLIRFIAEFFLNKQFNLMQRD